MTTVNTFRQAVRLLRSLPNWEDLQETYGGLDDHLEDIENDLKNYDTLEELTA